MSCVFSACTMRENGIKFDLYNQNTVNHEELCPFCSLIHDQWPLKSADILFENAIQWIIYLSCYVILDTLSNIHSSTLNLDQIIYELATQ